jgi:transposase
MASHVTTGSIGIDVAKDWLDIYVSQTGQAQRIDNTPAAIAAWVAGLAGPVAVAVEATNDYHQELVSQASTAGHLLYLVDALRLHRYRQAVGVRAKTDLADAALLARYLQAEGPHLRPYRLPDPQQQVLWQRLKRRATLVRATTQLQLSLGDLGADAQDLLRHCRQVRDRLERELLALARQLGWGDELARCQAIPGIGPLTALGLVAAYHRGTFTHHDQFIAFLGLDVRVRDSGHFRGKRRLSKHGEPELRRLLYNAAMAACRQPLWQAHYQQLRTRLSTTAALVALARKLVKVSFALLKSQANFEPSRLKPACAGT